MEYDTSCRMLSAIANQHLMAVPWRRARLDRRSKEYRRYKRAFTAAQKLFDTWWALTKE